MPPLLYKKALNIYLIRTSSTADTASHRKLTLTARIDLKSKLAKTRQYNLLG